MWLAAWIIALTDGGADAGAIARAAQHRGRRGCACARRRCESAQACGKRGCDKATFEHPAVNRRPRAPI
jgi:hypothetical protein